MGSVGLLYVGAILFLNGCMLLGWVNGKSAVPLNIFVGVLQVVTPTYLIFTADGNTAQIIGASGLYLFGFTYLYVAYNLWNDLDGTGLGFFSLFVAICAVVYAAIAFNDQDYAFGVIWLYWSFLWLLFFLLLGKGRAGLGLYTGSVAAIQGWVTGAIPAFLLLTGRWADLNNSTVAVVLAVFGVVVFGALFPVMRRKAEAAAMAAADPSLSTERNTKTHA
jgi:putative amide transporter protein